MSVSLFTVACGYIGARALPEILLDKAWTERINDIQVKQNLALTLCQSMLFSMGHAMAAGCSA